MAAERIRIRVSADKLDARVSIEPGEPAAEAELRMALEAAGVEHGVDESVVARLSEELADPAYSAADELIAAGEAPKPGADGLLDLAFSVGLQAGKQREDGTLDFRERDLLKPVSCGERVATYHPPEPGTAGVDVTGRALDARDGQECLPPLGRGVSHLPSGEIVAERDGIIEYSAMKCLDVLSRLEHRCHVDMRSGNLDMEGCLVIRGDIMRGFSVRATDSVEVYGTVDGGTILAGSAVKISGGVIGSDSAKVCAEGELTLRHGNGANLSARGNLLCSRDLINCQSRAINVRVERSIRGGRTLAERSIRADEAGSRKGTATLLAVGGRFELPAEQARRRLRAKRAERQAKSRRVRGPRGGSQRQAGPKSALLRRDVQRESESVSESSEPTYFDLLRAARIEIRGTLHPGVTVRFGRRRFLVDKPEQSVCLRLDPVDGSILKETLS